MLSFSKFCIKKDVCIDCAQFTVIVIYFAVEIGLDMDGRCVAHGIAFYENRLPFADERRLKMSFCWPLISSAQPIAAQAQQSWLRRRLFSCVPCRRLRQEHRLRSVRWRAWPQRSSGNPGHISAPLLISWFRPQHRRCQWAARRTQFLAVVIDFAVEIGFDMDGGCVAHGIVFLWKPPRICRWEAVKDIVLMPLISSIPPVAYNLLILEQTCCTWSRP